MDKSIRAGVIGFSFSLIMNMFSPTNLFFVPSFLGSILAIYLLRIETFKDGLITSLLTYLFNDAVLGSLILATAYIENQPYTFTVDILTVFIPILSAVTAVISTYVGVKLVRRAKTNQRLPPQIKPIPPV